MNFLKERSDQLADQSVRGALGNLIAARQPGEDGSSSAAMALLWATLRAISDEMGYDYTLSLVRATLENLERES